MKSPLPHALHLGGIALLALLYHRAQPSAVVEFRAPAAPVVVPAARVAPPVVASTPVAGALPADRVVATDPRPLVDQLTTALQSDSPVEHYRAFNRLLPRLIAENPSMAGHLALAWAAGPMREEILRQVVRQWAEADVGGALTWLTSLLDADDRRLAATTATAQVAQADPAGALDLAQMLHVDVEDGSFEHLAQLWTEEDPRAAVDWVKAQPVGPARDRLLARIAWVRAQSDPAEAANLTLTQMSVGEAQTAAVVAVVRQWAVREPAEATEWVDQFSPGPLRDRALAELATARKLTTR